ncbi:hypothetical protein MOQ_002092, partial [Trypanosoma cruzi marinkellei]
MYLPSIGSCINLSTGKCFRSSRKKMLLVHKKVGIRIRILCKILLFCF